MTYPELLASMTDDELQRELDSYEANLIGIRADEVTELVSDIQAELSRRFPNSNA